MSANELLLNQLDGAVARYTGSRLRQVLRSPVDTCWRFVASRTMRSSRGGRQKQATIRPFFGDSMLVTIPPAAELYFCGLYRDQSEINLARYFILNIQEGDVFFDIGAHFGYYSLIASKLAGSRGVVYAFEPSSSVLPSLRETLKNHRNIRLVEKAVCNQSGTVEFFVGPGEYAVNSTMNPADLLEAGFKAMDSFGKVTAQAIRLDDFCDEQQVVPKFIKIDVEGAEEHVIRGARSLLERHSLSLAIEVWFGTFTTNYARSLQLLNEFGYKTNAIREDGSLIPLDPADIPEYAKQVCADRRFAHALDNLIFTK